MVCLTAKHPMLVYRVLDRDGEAIGEVREPRDRPVVGWGAETVLLVRSGVVPLPSPVGGTAA